MAAQAIAGCEPAKADCKGAKADRKTFFKMFSSTKKKQILESAMGAYDNTKQNLCPIVNKANALKTSIEENIATLRTSQGPPPWNISF